MQLISQARLYLSQNAQNTVDKLSWIQQTASTASKGFNKGVFRKYDRIRNTCY